MINDRPAKSSSNVIVGDKLEIGFGNKTMVVRITQIIETTKKSDAAEMYEILETRQAENFD